MLAAKYFSSLYGKTVSHVVLRLLKDTFSEGLVVVSHSKHAFGFMRAERASARFNDAFMTATKRADLLLLG